MSTGNSVRFRDVERVLTIALIAAAVCFLLFLIGAGFGVVWLKAVTAIVTLLVSALALVWLYRLGEVKKLRLRSRYLVFGFGALLLCTLLSLLLNYPSPAPVTVDPNTTALAALFQI